MSEHSDSEAERFIKGAKAFAKAGLSMSSFIQHTDTEQLVDEIKKDLRAAIVRTNHPFILFNSVLPHSKHFDGPHSSSTQSK